MSIIVKETKHNISNSFTNSISDPLEVLFERIKKNYPLKKYYLKEKLQEQLVPQSKIIYATLEPNKNFSNALYSYITFHQIYFHLKNYILKKKRKYNGYKNEFLDIFEDIFIDNFLIFKEILFYLDKKNIYFLNIWLDGFFLNLFNNLIVDKKKVNMRIQPQLFFIIILYLSLPELTQELTEVPFTSIIKFGGITQINWKLAIKDLKLIDIKKPSSRRARRIKRNFIFLFFNINVDISRRGELVFDEENALRCVDFINTLTSKTDEMIDNIKKMRNVLLEK